MTVVQTENVAGSRSHVCHAKSITTTDAKQKLDIAPSNITMLTHVTQMERKNLEISVR
jgi:hypothetical protein